MSTSEIISPLIKVCRKLHVLRNDQVPAMVSKLCAIFKKHYDDRSLLKLLVRALCEEHASIPLDMLTEIGQLLPSERILKIRDSITLNDIYFNQNEYKKKEEKPLNFLQIPTAIKILTFNFVSENDLYQIQKVCRCL